MEYVPRQENFSSCLIASAMRQCHGLVPICFARKMVLTLFPMPIRNTSVGPGKPSRSFYHCLPTSI